MRGKATKWMALSMAAALALTTACQKGSGGAEQNGDADQTGSENAAVKVVNETGFPIVNEPIKLKFVAPQATNTPDWNDIMLFNEYEKMTGIDIEWQMINQEILSEKRNLILAGGDLPDAFYATLLSDNDVMKYGEQGVFIKLNDLIEEYAPNIKKFLEDNPDAKKWLTMPDGNIYSIPRVYDPAFTSVLINPKTWINTKWTGKLGLKNPETTEELYQFLKSFKGEDLNGNGEADEIPLGALSTGYLMKWLYGPWDLQNRGSRHNYVDVDPETNDLRFFPADEKYRELLEFAHRLYQEQLIDPDIFTMNSSEFLARIQSDRYGVYIGWDPVSWVQLDYYEGAPPLAGPHGDKAVVSNSPLVTLGTFVITNQNAHPEATMRWIDHFFSDEGSRMFFMGFEGVTYAETEDGKVEYLDKIANHPDGLSLDEAVSQYLIWSVGGTPGIISEQYFKGGESLPNSIAAAELLEPYANKEVWPAFSFTPEENSRLAGLSSDIGTYVSEMRAKFITGAKPLAEWDDYVQTINKMGLEEYMKIYKAAFERYSND
ncbi:extracellular solute-binding protein [Paenibacillus sp. J2TS4]|uniref:extracellular solute-binding protein n=1 Tax=Paenibacillus sp. J2TS4 TaxID=2807194 RepID=UPI001B00EECC|nr:extracellular solute-binding protein [Paenibacillus sp. J2TS4]GIP35003.1 ABC transporter substrate-binding protein [Paenibacillus sp. J2TS4]